MTKDSFRQRRIRALRGRINARNRAPSSVQDELTPDQALARIAAISQNARTTWFALLGVLTFVLVTLMSIEGIDFFGHGRLTELPLVGVEVPTRLFFWAVPPLTAVIYAYFHFYLLKLWDALAATGPQYEGDPLGEHVTPWLLSDGALRLRPDGATRRRALGVYAGWTSFALTWGYGWLVLFYAWWASMVAHNVVLSLLIGACMMFTFWVGLTSWIMMHIRLRKNKPRGWLWLVWAGGRGGRRVVVLVAAVTVLRTFTGHGELAIGGQVLLTKNELMASADLSNEDLTTRPPDWRERDLARTEFRKTWCDRQDLTWAYCVEEADRAQDLARAKWCEGDGGMPEAEDCAAYFDTREQAFQTEWERRREAYLASLTKPDLNGTDLRSANLAGVFLPGLNLFGARMEGADLTWARMEGAVLVWARMEGAVLTWARMEGAVLSEARMEGANLTLARMEGANLTLARIEGAVLSEARMERANLTRARMEGAVLSEARMEGANLIWARMEGAVLNEARMEGANLIGARMGNVDLTNATGVTQTMLAYAVGNEATVLPLDATTGEQLFIWSCWTKGPIWLHISFNFDSPEEQKSANEKYLCDGRPRYKTGRTEAGEVINPDHDPNF